MKSILLFLVTLSVFAQTGTPRYLEQHQMYDYQYESLTQYRSSLQEMGYPAAEIEQMVQARTQRFRTQAGMIRPREQRYAQSEESWRSYRDSMIRFYRETNIGTRLTNDQIVQHYVSQGNTAMTRQHYRLDQERAQIDGFHNGFRSETGAGDVRVMSSLAATNRPRVPMLGGSVSRYVSQGVTMGGQSINVNRVRTPGHAEIIVGFHINNDGKNSQGGTREFHFISPTNDPTHAGLKITENAQASGRMSHDLMETSIYFIPRRNVPAMRYDSSRNAYAVTLPTGEVAYYDSRTMQLMNIPESALHSGAQDISGNRHTRNFADIQYQGSGLTIRVDARAGNPEVPRSTPFNSNEQGAQAILSYNGDTCRVPKNDLFSTDNNESGTFYIRLTDQELNERILGPRCGWDISDMLSSPAPAIAAAPIDPAEQAQIDARAARDARREARSTPSIDLAAMTPEELLQARRETSERWREQAGEAPLSSFERGVSTGDLAEQSVLEGNILLAPQNLEVPEIAPISSQTPGEEVAEQPAAEPNEIVVMAPRLDLSIEESCEDLISEYFSDTNKKAEVMEYLKNQGKVTLHRLALMALNSHSSGNDLSETINEVIAQRNPELHQQFLSAAQDMSRNKKLLVSMGELHAHSQTQEISDELKLKIEDLYMMEFLVKAEDQHGRSASRGVMDFTSIIKNSLKSRLNNKESSKAVISGVISELEQQQTSFENETLDFLTQHDCLPELNQALCVQRSRGVAANINQLVGQSNPVLKAIFEEFKEDEDLTKESFRWNTYWLHVGDK